MRNARGPRQRLIKAALAATVALTACGGDDDSASQPDSTTATTADGDGPETAGDGNSASTADGVDSDERFKVVAVMANVTDPYFITMECGAKHAAREHNIDLEWTGATNADIQTQLENTDAALLQQPDAIIQTPFDPNAFVEPVRRMMDDGVTYLMVDGALAEKVAWKYIVTEHEGLDEIVGGPIAEAMEDSGKIGIIAHGPDNTIDRIRWETWATTFPETHPEIAVLEPQWTESDTARAATAASALINGNPDLKAIFATNGPELAGVASAVSAAGKEGEILVFGYAAGVPQDLELIRSGVVTGIWVQAPYVEGVRAIELLAEWLPTRVGEEGPVPGGTEPYEHNTPLFYINGDNIDDEETKPYYGLTSADGPTC